MKTKAKHSFFRRAAIALLTMLLTATTAGAQEVTFSPALQPSYTFTGYQIRPSFSLVYIDGVEYSVHSNEDDAASSNGAYIKYQTTGGINAGTNAGSFEVYAYPSDAEPFQVTCRFDIVPREVTVIVDNKEKNYGDADPAFTCYLDPSTTGGVHPDTVLIHWKPQLAQYVTLTREAGELPGTYAITTVKATPFKFAGHNVVVTAVTPGTLTVTANPADWAETATDEYTIKSAAGWDVFCDLLDGGTSFSGKTVKLGADIGTADSPVTRMAGSGGHEFCGTFDGGGHTISGLNIVSDVETVGFIGSLEDDYYNGVTGTLKNLTLKNCTVTNVYSGNGNVGMLVGSCNGGRLENCRVLGGSVMASSDEDPEDEYYVPSSAGAIAGYCILGEGSTGNYYDQKVGVFVDGEPQTPGKCGTGDQTTAQAKALAQAMIITLADDDDNSSDIWTFRGVAAEVEDTPEFLDKSFEVTLTGRTLWKDGGWNTLCLPFALTAEQIADSPLAGADIRTLSDASFSADGTLTLDFTPAPGQAGALTEMEAGKPYIIKWAASTEHIVNPVFRGVTLDATDRSLSFDLDTTEGERGRLAGTTSSEEVGASITFSGTYDAMAFDAAEPSILFLGGSNTLYYPQSGAKIGAQRAYFQLDGLTAGESTSQVRAFNLNFGSEDTGIVSLSKESGNQGNNPEFLNSLDYYTLDGVKLDGKPTKKGLYIHAGRKVVIK